MKIAIVKVENEVPVTVESLEKELKELKEGRTWQYSASRVADSRAKLEVPQQVLDAISVYAGSYVAFIYNESSDECNGQILSVQPVDVPR